MLACVWVFSLKASRDADSLGAALCHLSREIYQKHDTETLASGRTLRYENHLHDKRHETGRELQSKQK